MKRTSRNRSVPAAPAAAAAVASFFCAAAFWAGTAAAASMYDYCQVPPYVVQNVAPNVMLLIDTSGSMFNFAYFDGYDTQDATDDNLCNDITKPCTNFNPSVTYYGYFNPQTWYAYSSNRFVPQGLKGSYTRNPATDWDGNFLNWLTMRRVDVLRKVMTGGKTTTGEGSGYDRLVGEVADCDARGKYKRVSNAANYTPYSGTRKFYVYTAGSSCSGGGSGTSRFSVRNDSGGGDGTGDAATFNVAVRVPSPVEGVLQSVVGSRARLGLAFFNTPSKGDDGSFVQVYVSGGSLSSTVNQINLTRPNANTPLGESLWSVAGYFAQQASILSGPGPRYNPGDYQINNNYDPLNFGSGGSPRWPTCSKSFVLLITDGEPCADGYLPAVLNDYANGRSPYNCQGTGCTAVAPFTSSTTFPSCSAGGNVAGLEDVALWAHTTDLRNKPVVGVDNIARNQNLTLYTIFAFGKGSLLLRYAAINGGFEDSNGNDRPDLQQEWDKNGDGEPDNFYEANEGAELEQAVRNALSTILKRASSGTAASVLASGEGSGANLIQAVFYPRRRFGNDIVGWTGTLQNLWYFVDPFFTNASIREETTVDGKLNLANDYIAQFYFDTAAELTKVRRFVDSDGNGSADSTAATVGFEELKNLWEAGDRLRQRDITSSPRTIYTTVNGSVLIPFHTDNVAQIGLANLQAADAAEAQKIITFVTGTDVFQDLDGDQVNDYRLRTALFGSDNAVWRLGDVVNSTPRIVAGVPLNTYHKVYQDATYQSFIDNAAYKNRGMVFTGGNDGMLHAFKLGKLELSWTGQGATEKARLTNPDPSTPLGHEMWAFVPKNALPYLKYMMDPDYCHLFYVDLSPYVFDASIAGNPGDVRTAASWRTVLIGGMRTGGACRNLGASCSDCVKTPVNGVGYSSYFAFDVTDPANPTLLWEFSNPNLGFATTGPAVIRLNWIDPVTGAADRTRNGHWYVVFGSGPTGGIDNVNNQFLGKSDQNLRLFVLDLKTGSLVRTIDTGIAFAFAGSFINGVADVDLDYSDDALYFGYVRKNSVASDWTQGGVARLFTKGDTQAGVPNWEVSRVVDGIGPVTSSVARLQNNVYHINWLYFGTGRFFFEQPATGGATEPTVDDGTNQRHLFGIKEPCFTSANTINTSCTTTETPSFTTTSTVWRDASEIANVPSESLANSAGFKGWRISLDASGNYAYDNTTRLFRAERVITDPLSTTAGLVFFTTYKPYGDECALGGKSFLWAVKYNTGGAAAQALLKGKALVQVSTASVEQIDLSQAFQGDTTVHRSGRRSAAIEGVPPTAQGLSLITSPPPVKRVLHMRER